jgi:hypothetical protein
MTYRDYAKDLAPRGFLRDPTSQSYLGALGGAVSDTLALYRGGVESRFARTAPDDGLPYIGDARQIERAPLETEDDYRARLQRSFEIHSARTTKDAYVLALEPLGVSADNIRVYNDYENKLLSITPPDTAWWSRVLLVIDSTDGPWTQPVWDPNDVWDPDAVWGVDGLTQAEVKYLRRQIRRHKWAGAFPYGMVIIFDNTTWPIDTDWSSNLAWIGDPTVVVAPLGRTWGWNEAIYGTPDLWMTDEVWRDPFDLD